MVLKKKKMCDIITIESEKFAKRGGTNERNFKNNEWGK